MTSSSGFVVSAGLNSAIFIPENENEVSSGAVKSDFLAVSSEASSTSEIEYSLKSKVCSP